VQQVVTAALGAPATAAEAEKTDGVGDALAHGGRPAGIAAMIARRCPRRGLSAELVVLIWWR